MLDTTYPDYLVPRLEYHKLACEPFLFNGLVLRSINKPAVISPGGLLSYDSFSFPQTNSLVRHFSVNLLGVSQIDDGAWKINKQSERSEELLSDWHAGEDGICPRPSDSQRSVDGEWGYFWLPLVHLHNRLFAVGDERYKCQVLHMPVKCNYWHFELHFSDAEGNDLASGKNLRSIATGIRALLITEAKVIPLNLKAWPEDMYRTVATPTLPFKTSSFWERILQFLKKIF